MDIGNIFEEWDFSGTVPLPYRVLLMGCIGIFAWGSNLHILTHLRVDVSNLLFSSPPLSGVYTNHPRHSREKYIPTKSSAITILYRSIYTLGVAFLFMVLINMWMYKWVVAGSEPINNNKSKSGSPSPTTGDARGGMGLTGNPRVGIMVPILGYLTIVLMIFVPFNVLFKKERYRFLRSMKKALFSGFKTEVTFADVILADILTSFARVFGDLAVALCLMFLDRNGSNGDACYGSILVPIMTSIPYCIRLRQCLSEYIESNYTVERHLMNALKYASAFPVIIISSMQKSSKTASMKGLQHDGYFSDNSLFRLWLFFVALNSFYSFYWDIYHDWSLIQAQPAGRSPSPSVGTPTSAASPSIGVHSRISSGPLSPTTPKSASATFNDLNGDKPLMGSPSLNSNNNSNNNSGSNTSSGGNTNSNSLNSSSAYSAARRFNQWGWGMRTQLHYEDRLFYIMAVILDFLLRTTWMLKLVSNIQIEEYEGGVFTMECLEVLRRWIWVLFRFESELVKRSGYSNSESNNSPSGPDLSGSDMGHGMDSHNNEVMMEDLESWQK
ncbi:protein-ER retention protein [Mortierella sp. AD031]|nr:protein-ER retention protein [Mortierella sp. AD031]KAG0209317.1 protein-ER retention protein [Mortierella sp. NVP41]